MDTQEILRPYENFFILIPTIVIFFLILAIVMRSLKEMPLFEGPIKPVVGLCVSVLAIYGMDQVIIRTIVIQYSTMGVVLLFGLAGLILAAWGSLVFKSQKHFNHSKDRQDDEIDID